MTAMDDAIKASIRIERRLRSTSDQLERHRLTMAFAGIWAAVPDDQLRYRSRPSGSHLDAAQARETTLRVLAEHAGSMRSVELDDAVSERAQVHRRTAQGGRRRLRDEGLLTIRPIRLTHDDTLISGWVVALTAAGWQRAREL